MYRIIQMSRTRMYKFTIESISVLGIHNAVNVLLSYNCGQ